MTEKDSESRQPRKESSELIEPNLQAGISDLPPKNPYPVLSIARSSQVIYANAAARSMIKNWKNRDGQPALEFCRQLVEETLSSGQSTRIVEIEYEDRTFSLTVILNEDQSSVDLFGIDITERKATEEKVHFGGAIYAERKRRCSSGRQHRHSHLSD